MAKINSNGEIIMLVGKVKLMWVADEELTRIQQMVALRYHLHKYMTYCIFSNCTPGVPLFVNPISKI